MEPQTPTAALIDRINAALPQTQCGRCGYPGCRPYAEAIARGEAAINRCPPGGAAGVHTLAQLTGQPDIGLDPACGPVTPPRVAFIDEDVCIGCTKCIQACPVDAIVGLGKRMHTVVADLCTGCELCVAPCPVDCIALVPVPAPTAFAARAHADAARERHAARTRRLTREHSGQRAAAPLSPPCLPDQRISRTEVLAAITRGRAKRHAGRA